MWILITLSIILILFCALLVFMLITVNKLNHKIGLNNDEVIHWNYYLLNYNKIKSDTEKKLHHKLNLKCLCEN